jgi:hypothetical protein
MCVSENTIASHHLDIGMMAEFSQLCFASALPSISYCPRFKMQLAIEPMHARNHIEDLHFDSSPSHFAPSCTRCGF